MSHDETRAAVTEPLVNITDAMLNPALVASTIAWAAAGYEKAVGEGMPWELAFVVVPLCLARRTREALPTTSRTHLPRWSTENPGALAGLATIARRFAPHVRQGLRVGLRHEILRMDTNYLLHGKLRPVSELDAAPILRSASILGAVFGKAGSSTSVFAALGVSP